MRQSGALLVARSLHRLRAHLQHHVSACSPRPACPLAPRATQRPANATRTHCSSSGASSSTVSPPQQVHTSADDPPAHLQRMKGINYCRVCGSPMSLIRHGKHEWRHTCSNVQCGYIDYLNPRMVVGCIAEHQGRILLCRRAIEPCRGLWTVPAGFMELAESSAEGAARETREEACTDVHVIAPYAHWDIPVIGQAYILFRGQLAPPYTHGPGPESLETRLFLPSEIPFEQIAFSSVSLSLRLYLEDMQSGQWRMHHGVIDKKPGSSPNDPSTFGLGQLLQFSVHQHTSSSA